MRLKTLDDRNSKRPQGPLIELEDFLNQAFIDFKKMTTNFSWEMLLWERWVNDFAFSVYYF